MMFLDNRYFLTDSDVAPFLSVHIRKVLASSVAGNKETQGLVWKVDSAIEELPPKYPQFSIFDCDKVTKGILAFWL